MIIDDDSSEETIYQTEKDGQPLRSSSPRPTDPTQAPDLGDPPDQVGDGWLGRVQAKDHEVVTVNHSFSGLRKVTIFDKAGKNLDTHGGLPDKAILYVEGRGANRKIVWRHQGTHP